MIERRKTSSGITLLLEELPSVRTACFGCYIESGSRHEPSSYAGVSHFIEHMVFKGTAKRSAGDIAREFDLLGGQSNAFTSKECTAYYAKTLDVHLPKAIDILGDMITNSLFREEDVALERKVILEEINMYEDSPEDLAVDRLLEKVYVDQAVGREIMGSAQTLNQLTGEKLLAYKTSHYTSGSTVLAVSGHFDRSAVIEACDRAFEQYPTGEKRHDSILPVYHRATMLCPKEIEQNHLVLGFPGLSFNDELRFDAAIAINILGAGMSSRLFQVLREELGLSYSVYSFSMPLHDSGFTGIYSAQSPASEKQAATKIVEVIRSLVRQGVTAEELLRAKEHLKINTIMGFEGNYSRMAHMAKGELLKDKILSADETIERIDQVSMDRVNAILPALFNFSELSVGVVGTPADGAFYTSL